LLERDAELFISSIELLPECQNRGIGTHLIKTVIQDAEAKGKRVALQVLKVNPARQLYERLGFVMTGETATHILMARSKP